MLPPGPENAAGGRRAPDDPAPAAETSSLPPAASLQAENWCQLITRVPQPPPGVPRQEQPRGLPCPPSRRASPPRPSASRLPAVFPSFPSFGPSGRDDPAGSRRPAAPRTAGLRWGAGGKRGAGRGGAELSLPRPACCGRAAAGGVETEIHGLDLEWEWARGGGQPGAGGGGGCLPPGTPLRAGPEAPGAAGAPPRYRAKALCESQAARSPRRDGGRCTSCSATALVFLSPAPIFFYFPPSAKGAFKASTLSF